MKTNITIKKLVSIYMNEFKSSIKDYTIINYFEYEYYHNIDIQYYDNENVKNVLTIELKISSNKMLSNILKDQSIKKYIKKSC